MALTKLATPVTGTTLTANLWNNEFDNIYNNGLSLVSPLTGNLDTNNKQLTNARVENVTATGTAAQAGRLTFHTTYKQLVVDDGAQNRYVVALYDTRANRLLMATGSNQYGYGPSYLTATGTAILPATSSAGVISTTITCTGAAVGDPVVAGHTALTMASVLISGRVTSTNTVTVDIFNGTGATLNPGSGTLRVHVLPA